MKNPLQILLLEKTPNDAVLVEALLIQAKIPCSIRHMETSGAFLSEINRQFFDLVIADYSLSGFKVLAEINLARTNQARLPFVLVSGVTDDDIAIKLLESGVTDYVLRDHPSKLVPAVRRVMNEIEARLGHEELERQLIQAQKMEVIGQLSGGVAHDFNNVIAVIMGNNDYALGHLKPGDPLRTNLEEIRHAAKRAAALTQQLLVFSRNQTLQPTVLDLNEVISSMDKMLSRMTAENIELAIIPERPIGRIKADSGYIGQLLMNLVVNARDAMPEGGRLSIKTRNVTLPTNDLQVGHGLVPGDYVALSVCDTGIGISEEIRKHLFEPFFTTKPTGKGTGLGLATCQTIARQLGAHIEVDSAPGKGTTFLIYFPRIEQPLESAATFTKTATLSRSRGSETLLVVEDETALRRVAVIALRAQGYTVLQAATGQEGLRVASDHKGAPIDLVITDIVMPQMGGKVMVEWLKATYPNLKILFTSGYTAETVAHEGQNGTESAFLPKPYNLGTLTRKIRDVLDAA